jgi:uncharacterized phage-like protein YoqJ
MICAFTGHRPDKLGGWDPLHPVVGRIRKGIRDALAREWPLYAICGMALGVDTWAAETCVEMGIPFIAALPCDDMDAKWPLPSCQRLERLLEKAREVIVVSPGPYQPWKMQRRNEWMVDHCTRLYSVFDGSSGGTYNCLEYAAQVGREVKEIAWKDTTAYHC